MKSQLISFAYFAYFIFLGSFKGISGQDAEIITEETASEGPQEEEGIIVYSDCERFGGHYAKLSGYTCCGNETLENIINESDDIFQEKCSKYLHEVNTDDLPMALWRQHVCVLKTNGAADNDLSTFKGYMNYMSMNYTEALRAEILKNAIGKCKDADAEKDDMKRLKMFHLCMYKAERTVCHRPYKTKEEINIEEDKMKFCKPEEDFPYFGERCCKGKPVPYPVPLVHLDTEKSNTTEKVKCIQSYIERQKQLNPDIKKGEEEIANHHNFQMDGKLADRCTATCERSPTPFTTRSALKIDMEEMKKSMFTLFSETIRKDLLLILDKYLSEKSLRMFESDNSTVSVTEAIKIMATKDELAQIHLFCHIQNFIINELEVAALDAYCFDDTFAKRFWSEDVGPGSNITLY